MALHVAPANVDDGVRRWGYTGEKLARAAEANRIALEVVKAPEAKRGFVLLPRRCVAERSLAWATCCRRLVKDYERYASTLAGLHMLAVVGDVLSKIERIIISSWLVLIRRTDNQEE